VAALEAARDPHCGSCSGFDRYLLFSVSRFLFLMARRLVVRPAIPVARAAVAMPGTGTALGLRAARLENRDRGTGSSRRRPYAHGSLGRGATSGQVSLPAAPVLLAVVLGRQLFPQFGDAADPCRTGRDSSAWRLQPGRTGRPTWFGESDSAVGGVGLGCTSLGLDKPIRAETLRLTCHSII
jgi:hypothetical protein